MALDDIYRVRLTQVFDTTGPQSVNIFHYKQVFALPSPGNAAELSVNFRDQVEPLIRDLQVTLVSTLQIAVENVVPGTDNAYLNFAVNTRFGTEASESLPPYAAWAFRLNRTSSAVRNGQKRFMGVPETFQVNGQIIAGIPVTRANALAAILAADLGGVGVFNTYRPVIYRRAREVEVIPAKTIPALAAQDFAISSGAFVSISTQNSRKFGSGT